MELVFATLALLLFGSAALIAPLCKRDICEMRRGYQFEMDAPGGRGRGRDINNDETVELNKNVEKNKNINS